MKKKTLALLSIGFLFWTCLSLANATTQLIHFLGHYTTYQARFNEETVDEQGRLQQRTQGNLYIQRPGKFRWDSGNPVSETIIADGDQLWVYEVDLQQATEQKIGQGQTNPAELLTADVDHLVNRYQISLVKLDGYSWYQLVPKSKTSGFQSVLLRFDHGLLVGLRIKNNLNQTSDYTFSDVKVNQHIAPSLFQFKAPKGVDVSRQ